MTDIYFIPQAGTVQHDIHTVIQVAMTADASGNYPVGIQAYLKPLTAAPTDLSVSMGDFTQSTTWSNWQFSKGNWDAITTATNPDGYKLVTLNATNPAYGGPFPGDNMGFDLVSINAGEWSLQSAAFTGTRIVPASAVAVPEPSTWAYSLFAGVVLIIAALKGGNK